MNIATARKAGYKEEVLKDMKRNKPKQQQHHYSLIESCFNKLNFTPKTQTEMIKNSSNAALMNAIFKVDETKGRRGSDKTYKICSLQEAVASCKKLREVEALQQNSVTHEGRITSFMNNIFRSKGAQQVNQVDNANPQFLVENSNQQNYQKWNQVRQYPILNNRGDDTHGQHWKQNNQQQKSCLPDIGQQKEVLAQKERQKQRAQKFINRCNERKPFWRLG